MLFKTSIKRPVKFNNLTQNAISFSFKMSSYKYLVVEFLASHPQLISIITKCKIHFTKYPYAIMTNVGKSLLFLS
jgi:hypothetical protein